MGRAESDVQFFAAVVYTCTDVEGLSAHFGKGDGRIVLRLELHLGAIESRIDESGLEGDGQISAEEFLFEGILPHQLIDGKESSRFGHYPNSHSMLSVEEANRRIGQYDETLRTSGHAFPLSIVQRSNENLFAHTGISRIVVAVCTGVLSQQ